MVRRARVAAPLALAALSVVVALSLGRVVDSGRFVLPVLGAALLPHALGALVRWRGWSVWVGAAIATLGLAVYVVVALETSTTTAGLPGADTWHTLETQLSGGWHLLRTAPAPAPTTDGAILLAVLAVWVMAALADWLAFGRATALAATSPALVFFVWTSTLGTDDTQLLLTVGFCVAAGAFVLAQNLALLDQRRSWLVSQRGARPHWLAPAAVLGGTAVVVALLVAPILPGSGGDPLLDVAGTGREGAGGHSYKPSVVPFVDIGRKLDDVNDVELFTVQSPVPDYWRILALDQYSGDEGGSWTLSAEGDGSVSVGLPSSAPNATLRQRFTIGPLGERWLPAAYRPVAIDLPDTLLVRDSGTIVADADSISGLRYTVESETPPLAGTQISAAQIAATAAPVPGRVEQFTDLPSTTDIEQIAARAREVVDTVGATTPYAQAKALRDFFRSGEFIYDTQVGDLDNGSAILQFLNDKRGFCVQFASAYAVMARSLGIPARVAVGFTQGTPEPDGSYRVTSHDAHAWPEVYLSGLGWTHLFDPTPSNDSGPLVGGSDLPNDDAVAGARRHHEPARDRRHHAGAGWHHPRGQPRPVGIRHHPGCAAADVGDRDLVVELPRLAAGAPGARSGRARVRRVRRRRAGPQATAADAPPPSRRSCGGGARRVGGGARPPARGRGRAGRRADAARSRDDGAQRHQPRHRATDASARARVRRRALRRRRDRARRRARRLGITRRPRARARRRRAVDAPVATTPRRVHAGAPLTPRRRHSGGQPRLGWPSRAWSSATKARRSASKSRTSASTSSAKRSTATKSASCPWESASRI